MSKHTEKKGGKNKTGSCPAPMKNGVAARKAAPPCPGRSATAASRDSFPAKQQARQRVSAQDVRTERCLEIGAGGVSRNSLAAKRCECELKRTEHECAENRAPRAQRASNIRESYRAAEPQRKPRFPQGKVSAAQKVRSNIREYDPLNELTLRAEAWMETQEIVGSFQEYGAGYGGLV